MVSGKLVTSDRLLPLWITTLVNLNFLVKNSEQFLRNLIHTHAYAQWSMIGKWWIDGIRLVSPWRGRKENFTCSYSSNKVQPKIIFKVNLKILFGHDIRKRRRILRKIWKNMGVFSGDFCEFIVGSPTWSSGSTTGVTTFSDTLKINSGGDHMATL